MKTIWAVSSGSYSGYQVLSIFSTPEKAETFLATWKKLKTDEEDSISSYDDPQIEEFPFDITEADTRYTEITMARDGTVTSKRTDHDTDVPKTYLRKPHKGYGPWVFHYVLRGEHNLARAVKRANEIRTQLIAMGQWPADEYAEGVSQENYVWEKDDPPP